jgi:hypothetical protein
MKHDKFILFQDETFTTTEFNGKYSDVCHELYNRIGIQEGANLKFFLIAATEIIAMVMINAISKMRTNGADPYVITSTIGMQLMKILNRSIKVFKEELDIDVTQENVDENDTAQ